MPRLLRQILEGAVASQPDVTVIRHVRPSENLAAAAKRVRADIVILGEAQEGAEGAPWEVLDKEPRLKLLVISSDGHRATRYELRPHQVLIDDLSPEGLIDAVRTAMAH
jgi:DNA-binding NarL/FixJ family response regulator